VTSHIDFDRREGRLLFWDMTNGGVNWVDGKLQGPCEQINDLRGEIEDLSFSVLKDGCGSEEQNILAFSTSDGVIKVAVACMPRHVGRYWQDRPLAC